MLDVKQLNFFVGTLGLELKAIDDNTVVVSLEPSKLKPLSSFLKGNNAHFEASLVTKKSSYLEVKYFFYLGIKSFMLILETRVKENGAIPSLTSDFPALFSYEKEAEERFAIKFYERVELEPAYDAAPELHGDENSIEVPVGPIHAGVIEPGHFHFTCQGEHINNLSISLGYLHKNIEKEFVNRSIYEGLDLSENICGDSIVAYSLAFAQVVEKIKNISVSKRTQYTRMILLELERIYNHLGDIGGILNDTGFSFTNSYFSALKEKLLRFNNRIFGHRFLRGSIKIASVADEISDEDVNVLSFSLDNIEQEFLKLLDLTLKHRTVVDRLSKTGHLSNKTAKSLSVTGLVGKASGVSFDSRRDLSFAAYKDIQFHSHLRREGDVYARFRLRVDEIKESFHIINQCLKNLDSDDQAQRHTLSVPYSWSMVEAARGPVFVYLELDTAKGLVQRARFRDVSRHNWKALEYAVLKNIIPDFPLCNKSFSLAYAGVDL